MIVVSFSLDSSLEQAKLQGNLKALEEKYQLFTAFGRVALVTQDTRGYDDQLSEVLHVACAYSRFEIVRHLLSRFRFLRWLYFSYSSFIWLLHNRREVQIIIGENVDSPTPFLFSVLFQTPYAIYYHYDMPVQVGKINKRRLEAMLLLFLEKLCFKKATFVWITAPSLGKKAEALGARKVTLVPNWIEFNEKPEGLRKKPAEPMLLFVGRLHPIKQVHLLIKAFAQLHKTYAHASLHIIGDGEERQHLSMLTKELGLDNHVQFLGFQRHNRVLDMMRQAHVIVLPSKMEGNPRVLIEAMTLGLPIVATNVPGIRDIVKHAQTGHLVDEATPEDLAFGIDYVLRNEEYAANIAKNAFLFAEQHFSKKQVLKKIQSDLFSKVPHNRTNIALNEQMTPITTYSSLSVIIPAYNAEKTLEKCLSSIIQATPLEKEIIVVDDGSTDRTLSLISKFPVKLLHLDQNRGASAVKNVGLAQATGEVVAFVDSDCVVEQNYFRRLMSALNGERCNVGGVGGVIYPLESTLVSDSFLVRFFGCSPSSESRIRETDCLSGAASVYPKELLSKFGGFDARFRGGEDLDLSVRLRKAGYRLLIVPFAKVYHYHPTSLRHLIKKWFSYGQFLADVSFKNSLKKDLLSSWGWIIGCLVLFAAAIFTGNLFVWVLSLLTFVLPWVLLYGRQTARFWVRKRKIKYLALPFIHQIIIISRSLGVVAATFDHLFKIRNEYP